MPWIDQLREALHDFYPEGGPAGVLGYLKGSGSPDIWRVMARQNQPQMIILGNEPPTQQQWVAAGKPGPEEVRVVHQTDLTGLIILYGGFIYRPWGRIELLDAQALQHYATATIASFRRNMPRR